MFGWTIAFLVIALIAAALGFGVLAGTAFAAAKIIFRPFSASVVAECHRPRSFRKLGG